MFYVCFTNIKPQHNFKYYEGPYITEVEAEHACTRLSNIWDFVLPNIPYTSSIVQLDANIRCHIRFILGHRYFGAFKSWVLDNNGVRLRQLPDNETTDNILACLQTAEEDYIYVCEGKVYADELAAIRVYLHKK